MTTIAQDVAARFAIAFVAVAMVFTLFATPAQAQEESVEDLQALINSLLAQIAELEGDMGGDSMTSSVCPYTWTRDLSQGSEGADVMKLQQFLNSNPDTRLAASGAGSAGMETMYYGPLTAAAVSKMQVAYRAEVLTPVDLVNPTGYFGPMSRAKANSLCTAAPVDNGDDAGDDMTDEEEEEDTTPDTLSGEAFLDDFQMDAAPDDEIEEGASDAVVAEATVEFTDGDAEISRIDVKFDKTSITTENASDAFETISLWVDGDMIAEEDATDEDDYLSDEMTMRFTNLDIMAMEDEEVEILIAVSSQNNLDADELGTWSVSVDSMRFFDADGVATTLGSLDDSDFTSAETFTITEAGADDEIIVKTSSNDPDAATLQAEDDSNSDWFTVFVFDIDTDDSVNDIELDTVPVTVTVSSSTYDAIVDDVELVIDGTTIDDVTVVGGGTGTAILTFDVDGDVIINAGDRVAAELMLRFNSLALGNEGITVAGSVTSGNVDAISADGADTLGASQLSGAATGEAHTLRTAGVDVSVDSVSAVVTTPDGDTNDYATYEINVDVTAFEQDVYISTDAAVALAYALQDSAGSSSIAGTRSVVLTSTADEQGAYFEITEGETETLTLTVTYTPGVAGTQARLVLSQINFAPTAVAPTQEQTTLPATDYRTGVVTMVN